MKIKNVCNYLDVISTLKKFYGEKLEYGGKNEVVYAEFYFRGISNKEWSLIPRALNEKICVLTNDLYDEPLEIFKKEASGYLRNTCGTDNVLWIQYAQHYGVPTRLLDFTTNPLIALYFACSNENIDGAIWAINTHNYSYVALSKYVAGSNKEINSDQYFKIVLNSKCRIFPAFFTPEYIDVRMNAQSSRFLVWPMSMFSLDEYIKENNYMDLSINEKNTDVEKYAIKIIIGKESKKTILKELDMLGINEKSVFPGLDSIGTYLTNIFSPNYRDIKKEG